MLTEQKIIYKRLKIRCTVHLVRADHSDVGCQWSHKTQDIFAELSRWYEDANEYGLCSQSEWAPEDSSHNVPFPMFMWESWNQMYVFRSLIHALYSHSRVFEIMLKIQMCALPTLVLSSFFALKREKSCRRCFSKKASKGKPKLMKGVIF